MNGYERYTRGAIWFHWTIAALVITNVVLILGHEWYDWPSVPSHKAIGITVLFLSIARLAWRLAHRPPPLPRTVRPWERRLAHVNHVAFYVLIIALPLSGWWFSSAGAERRPLTFFGLFDIPYLPVSRGPEGLGGTMYAFHHFAGLTMIALIALHVAGALKHHLLSRDATLLRIAPLLDRRR